ncbi:MAG TPA: efflux RND transporter permease subunit, partial [Kofleriaceae bacterium]
MLCSHDELLTGRCDTAGASGQRSECGHTGNPSMWLIRTALRRPYTFVVMAMLIAIGGVLSIRATPTDIFPTIDIPVISVIWRYGGLQPDEMEKRIVSNFERFLTTIVSDIDHMESQSLTGTAVIKIYLQPGANISQAIAQTTAISQTAVRSMPPGTVPPLIMQYSATAVPIMQLAMESDTLSEQQLFDYGINYIRSEISTIPGAQIPFPYGGKQRQIMVDIDPKRLHALGLSPRDVQGALAVQNVILPSGTVKLGTNEYPIFVSSSPATLEELGGLPIKTVAGRTVYIRDVANVRDGSAPQTNLVHVEGRRSVLMTILKNGDASTLEVNARIREAIPHALERLPKEAQGHLQVKMLFDQSIFVRASIDGVAREALIAAVLTALMILMFLGSWRSTLTVVISIPLSILFSTIVLHLLGQTLNVMTLGGLALAVGILVDDATVAIENIHRNMHQRKPFTRAIIDGAQQIAIPAFVSTLCICIVFAPIAFLTGAARSLFVPMALAVVFAMLMSYLLSRTLVPTMVHHLLRSEVAVYQAGGHGGRGLLWTVHRGVNRLFEQLRYRYMGMLNLSLARRAPVLIGFMVVSLGSLLLVLLVGRDFFPDVDAGTLRLHARTPPGTRIEETEVRFAAVEQEIRNTLPANELDTILDNIGIPNAWGSLAQGDVPNVAATDGEFLISLNRDRHGPVRDYEVQLRKRLNETFPDMVFFFEPANITNQILNFGLPAPIDLQIVGANATANYAVAQRLRQQVAAIPGAADVHIHQVFSQPQINLDVDRVKAGQMGLTQRDVTSSMLISLSGNNQVAPSFWLNPANGINYNVGVQTSQYRIDSLDQLLRTPVTAASNAVTETTSGSLAGASAGGAASVGVSPSGATQAYGNPGATTAGAPQLLSNLVDVRRSYGPVIINHYNVAPVFDVYSNVDRTDLGSVGAAVAKIVENERGNLPRGTTLTLRGEYETMRTSFLRLGLGIVFAIVLVYLLMAVNFQSWIDSLIILSALPGAMAGILWMLFVTRTTLSVPSLVGSIMSIGVATANSILLVTFANDERA